jgi:hypothetical protein
MTGRVSPKSADLFLSGDLDYISKIYKYIFKQVHGIELSGRLKKEPIISDSSSQRRALEFYEKLEKECKSVKPDKNRYINHFVKFGLTTQLIDVIKNDKQLNKGKDVPKKVISFIENEICPKKEKSKPKKESQQDQTLPLPYQSSGNFLSDFDFLSNNNDFITIISHQKDWKKDLKWFIESHNKSHKDYKYWKDKPIDNESVIKQFIFLKKEIYKETEVLLKSLYLPNER